MRPRRLRGEYTSVSASGYKWTSMTGFATSALRLKAGIAFGAADVPGRPNKDFPLLPLGRDKIAQSLPPGNRPFTNNATIPITLAVVLPINAANTVGAKSKPRNLNPANMIRARTASDQVTMNQ